MNRRYSAVLGLMMGTSALVSGAQGADLGVLTSLDVCDDLGIAGLTLSSDANCLKISGEVEYELIFGDYDEDYPVIDDFAYSGTFDMFVGDGARDWQSTVTAKLTADAQARSDFGPVRGVITIEGTDEVVFEDLVLDEQTVELVLDEAYVSIGDTTLLMVGKKDSILEDEDDESFTFQKLFIADEADGVGFNSDATGTDIDDGGHVIQVSHSLGNGVTVAAGLEDLDGDGTAIGVVRYVAEGFSGHVSVLADEVLTGTVNDWAVHAGATATLDAFKLRAAVALNDDGWWNALGTAETTLDIFSLAIGAEATSEDEFGLGGSIGVAVTEGVILNIGSRALVEDDDDLTLDTVAEVEFEATETIKLIAGGGYVHESDQPSGMTYGRLSLEWEPGSGFESELTGRVHARQGSDLGYELVVGATKSFE